MSVEFPNKIYVVERKGDSFLGTSYYCVTVAGSDEITVRKHIKKQLGFEAIPVWINAYYPKIYTSDGSKPEEIQCKILYNGSCHYHS